MPPRSAAATSALLEAAYLLAVGALVFLAPYRAFDVFSAITFTAELTPIGDDPFYFRLFGLFGVASFCRANTPETGRGDAAAATWIFCGDESRAAPRPRR